MTAPPTNRLNGTQRPPLFSELGISGLERYSGRVYEEFHPDLRHDKAVKVYDEMRQNSPIVGACLAAMTQLIRQIEVRVEPGGDSPEDEAAAEFVDQCLGDMSHTWEDFIAEALTMLPFGWSLHEIVYKRRRGPARQPGRASKYDDGKIGWRKLPIRAQKTRDDWLFDDDGGIRGMYQRAAPRWERVFIPIEKAILFRTEPANNNPEGRSVLRSAYRPYYFQKRIEEIEGVAIEREGAGLPMLKVPPEVFAATDGPLAAALDAAKKLVTNVRTDEQMGVVLPALYDPNGNALYDFSLVTTGGQRAIDTSKVVERYSTYITLAMLCDFLLIGHENAGSWALSSDKTRISSIALAGWMDNILSTLNRHAIPRLLALNGFQVETPPILKHGDIEAPDLGAFGSFITATSGAGMQWFGDADDPEPENLMRSWAGLTPLTDEQLAARERQQEEQAQNEMALAQADVERARAETEQLQRGGGNAKE